MSPGWPAGVYLVRVSGNVSSSIFACTLIKLVVLFDKIYIDNEKHA